MNATARTKPHIEVRYIGIGRWFKNLDESVLVENHGYYNRTIYRALLRLPNTGHLVCEVTDALGTYRASEPIVSTGGYSGCTDEM